MNEQAFLQAIRDDPEDDTPRLVYADWLDEHDQPERAEFIRVQCEMARLPRDDPRRLVLQAREGQLKRRHAEEWLGPLRQRSDNWHFERGLAHLRVSARTFFTPNVSQAEAAAWRVVAGLTLWEVRPEDLVRLAGYPHRLPLTGLSVPPATLLEEGAVERLAGCAQLGHLAELRLAGNGVGPAGARALAASPHLGRLSRLWVRAGALGDEGAVALASWPHLGRLTHLLLLGNGIGPAGVVALAASPALGALEDLDLDTNAVGDEGARALASSPTLANLRELDLRGTGVGDAGAEALASSPNLGRLEYLHLYRNPIRPEILARVRQRFPAALRC
jgi:uncharacterized protein (TIGR02996 family)